MIRHAASLLILVSAAAACSSSDAVPTANESPADNSPSATGAGATGDRRGEPSSSSESTDPGECNALEQEAALNVLMRVARDAPVGAGGVLTDGKYLLTGYRKYSGSTGSEGPTSDSLRETLLISGNVVHTLQETSIGQPFRASFAQTVAGATFKHQQTCPGTLQGGKGSYTAIGDKVSFFDVVFGETTEREFTRQ